MSIPAQFPGETLPAVDPAHTFMSIVPRNCKVVFKATALPESQYASDPQLEAIYQLIKSKDPDTASNIYALNRYYARFVNDFHIKEYFLWMDDKLVIPNSLHTAINNRLQYYHQRKINKFVAAKDIWYPYTHRNIVSIAQNCQECILARENLKTTCTKGELGKILELKEPNKDLHLDFWRPITYLQESKKYVIVAVDRFSRWPSARVCNENRSDKILKFLNFYNNSLGKSTLIKERISCRKTLRRFVIPKALKSYSRRLMTIEPPVVLEE